MISVPLATRYLEVATWACLGMAFLLGLLGRHWLRGYVPAIASIVSISFVWFPVYYTGPGSRGGFSQILSISFLFRDAMITTTARNPFRWYRVGDTVVIYHPKNDPEPARLAVAFFWPALVFLFVGLLCLMCATLLLFGPF